VPDARLPHLDLLCATTQARLAAAPDTPDDLLVRLSLSPHAIVIRALLFRPQLPTPALLQCFAGPWRPAHIAWLHRTPAGAIPAALRTRLHCLSDPFFAALIHDGA
jgi:hypothetical protein